MKEDRVLVLFLVQSLYASGPRVRAAEKIPGFDV